MDFSSLFSTARPKILVHHVMGDFVLDPLAPGAGDLSRYGVTGYEIVTGDTAGMIPAESSLTSNLAIAALVLGGIVYALGRRG